MPEQGLLTPLAWAAATALGAMALLLPPLRRWRGQPGAAWLLAIGPLLAFVSLIGLRPAAGAPLLWRMPWLPHLNLWLSFYLDGLSALFGLIVAGIGALVFLYAGGYFKGDDSAPRFLTYLALFMLSMLGLVMAGDVITLFIFWEGTSITSFLLVAHKTKDEAARRGAFKALFITGGGGIALLAGLLLLAQVSGGSEFSVILASGAELRQSALYPVILGLIAFGAFTKSAQFPAHIWLPGAMSAPTPASAYLHSATMVKAGIYLLARLNPALGNTDAWFWLLSLVGLTTMLAGAYLGFKQNDLKALLAYSTVSQLGVLVMLIGQDTEIAFKALVVGVLAHALYKSSLFLVAGIVDQAAGTRDLRRLGGLGRRVPFTFGVAVVGALSMAGLPPLFGFLAKETLLATVTHPTIPASITLLFPAAAVAAGALLLAQAGLLVWETFLGQPGEARLRVSRPSRVMLLAALAPALLSLAIGLLPEPQALAALLAAAAAAAFGGPVKVSLALWTGINVPLLLSILAISLGLLLFLNRQGLRALQNRVPARYAFEGLYEGVLAGSDRLAYWATRLQGGKLRTYLSIMLAAALLLWAAAAAWGGAVGWQPRSLLTLPPLSFAGEAAILRVLAILIAVGSAVATIFLRRDFSAVIALTTVGLGVALLMVLEPAPDVGLVQIVVDILSTVILVLALARLPRIQRYRAGALTFAQSRGSLLRDALLSLGAGLVVAWLTLVALLTRPRPSIPTPFFAANAKPLTGAKDIVGAIVVDFRALDTLIEITVFALAGLGVYTLLRYASRAAGDQVAQAPPAMARFLPTLGIVGQPTSSFVHALAYAVLPLAMVIAVTHMMYGHDQPGDGFTAGVIISLAVAFWYVVFGYQAAKQRLAWLKPLPLIGAGLLLAMAVGLTAALITGSLLAPVDFGALLGLPLPTGFNLSTSFLFEVSICLAVLGSASLMLDTLGHPGEEG